MTGLPTLFQLKKPLQKKNRDPVDAGKKRLHHVDLTGTHDRRANQCVCTGTRRIEVVSTRDGI
jgi:hypothetical protein